MMTLKLFKIINDDQEYLKDNLDFYGCYSFSYVHATNYWLLILAKYAMFDGAITIMTAVTEHWRRK